ncbi:Dabb family protein [Pedobacter steynii]|uniref:Stress-response A/B barrel domain-containing protein n=1 Tax=Pedobacter steynii TaxID=430522 RepID=A0A1D7QLZ0_9SPHI|nr:Dabb family protein [Pedobacter steynii]AOM79623.1 hypothetical protein BFS30_22170 [Pedobacter steynii]
MSLLHILLFKVKPEISAAQADEFKTMFVELKDKIPGIERVHWAANISPSPFAKGWTEGCSMIFTSEAHRDAFLMHPEHVKLSAYRQAFADDLLIYDLEHPF